MPNRWVIAAAGVVMQVALGAVYAWSVFRIPLTKAFGWTIPQVTLTFTIAIFVLGFAAFAGGLWMRRAGPRVVAVAAGILYGLGVFLASFTDGRLWWLYLSYGLLGGIGLGPRLHRSGRHAGEMVSGSSRHDHGHRRCRIRFWRAGGRANRDATHRASRSAADVLHLRHRVSAGRHRGRTLHAESACGISPCGLGASGQPDSGSRNRRRWPRPSGAGSGTGSGRCCS